MTGLSGGDILSALLASSAFWLTVGGVAIRKLRLDFKTSERFLKDIYERADQASFSAVVVIKSATIRMLTTLYGSTIRTVLVTTLAATALNVYVLGTLRHDWVQRRDQIAALEERTIQAVNSEYFALVTDEAGRQRLARAVDKSLADGTYVNNSPEDRQLRGLVRQFDSDLEVFKRRHPEIVRDLTLARLFGRSYEYPGLNENPSIELLALLATVVVLSAIIDSIAAVATVALASAVLAGRAKWALVMCGLIAMCFVFSVVHYSVFIAGYGLAAGAILVWTLVIGIMVLFLVGALVAALSSQRRWQAISLFVGVLGFVAIGAAIQTWALELPQSWVLDALLLPVYRVRDIAQAIGVGIHPVAVLGSTVTLFPLLAVVSVAGTVLLLKILMVAGKEALLGQIHGATVIAGTTYLVGFLTTIISSTTAIVVLVRWLTETTP